MSANNRLHVEDADEVRTVLKSALTPLQRGGKVWLEGREDCVCNVYVIAKKTRKPGK
jgi:hypothetical protein